MNFFDHNFREIFFSQVVSIAGGLIAGLALAFYTDRLLLIPGLFVILPGFLEMRGNISGSFASRLSSGLFLKVIDAGRINTRLIRSNLVASFALAIIVSMVLGVLALAFNYFVSGVFLWKIVLLPLLAGIIANAIEIPLALMATFYLFHIGHDPNNIIGPFLTTTGDIVSIFALLIALVVI
ncbi:MAG TPA: hypothetical protein HA254_00320 [Candidatus Diapherotrites archaeon]|uniref:SLC41A/MgtE integral membrane domain-containing protein n=1 Tax=Candidatus Iainarchaeum sp. TaxID=3101447 RepID=A0A7J4IXV1_9ARCH|nr:hypothetical protein [Candidatus Diapherotrites archaeon]